MQKRKSKCSKCKEELDHISNECPHCGAKLTSKEAMLRKKDLKKMKEL